MTAEISTLLTDHYRGRLTRRAFFKRAIALGLSVNAAAALAACDAPGSSPSTHITSKGISTLIWESEEDTYGTFGDLTKKFTAFTPSIQVSQQRGSSTPINTGSNGLAMHDELVGKLRAGQGTPDILSLDVVWVSEFARNNWIVPLDDLWSAEERKRYLTVPLEAATYNGKIWAAPLHTDVGILYYRTDMPDIIPTAPRSWQDLVGMARQAMMASNGTKWGYVWQGANYEGMLCNFIELLSSYGGNIFDNISDPKVVIVNSDAALTALTEMVNWVGTISPPDTVRDQEKEAGDKWLNGDAAFMRNWPNYIAKSNDKSQSHVVGAFDIAPLPAKAHSCLGGWQLAINRFSPNKEAAWQFIKWMLQPDAQQYLAIKEGFPVTLESIYANNYFKQPESPYYNPFFNKLEPILNSAQFRPISPNYQEIAKAIETHVYSALLKQESPATALQALQAKLEVIIG